MPDLIVEAIEVSPTLQVDVCPRHYPNNCIGSLILEPEIDESRTLCFRANTTLGRALTLFHYNRPNHAH